MRDLTLKKLAQEFYDMEEVCTISNENMNLLETERIIETYYITQKMADEDGRDPSDIGGVTGNLTAKGRELIGLTSIRQTNTENGE